MLKNFSTIKKAYTLVELSIVLVIISIFLSSGLNIFTNNIVQTKTVNTKEKLNITYKSLAEYLMKNKKLPCPINLNIPKDTDTSYGATSLGSIDNCVANTIGTFPNQIRIGALPTIDLGLPNDMAEDDFGNKILYVVDNRLITNFVATDFVVADSGNGAISISGQVSGITKPVLLLLSFGANSCGSYKTNGQKNNDCTEQNDGSGQFKNSDNDTTFATSDTNPKFDDVVLTKTYYDFLQELNLTHTQSQAYFKTP